MLRTSSSVGRAGGKFPAGICRLKGLEPIARALIELKSKDSEDDGNFGVGSGVGVLNECGIWWMLLAIIAYVDFEVRN